MTEKLTQNTTIIAEIKCPGQWEGMQWGITHSHHTRFWKHTPKSHLHLQIVCHSRSMDQYWYGQKRPTMSLKKNKKTKVLNFGAFRLKCCFWYRLPQLPPALLRGLGWHRGLHSGYIQHFNFPAELWLNCCSLNILYVALWQTAYAFSFLCWQYSTLHAHTKTTLKCTTCISIIKSCTAPNLFKLNVEKSGITLFGPPDSIISSSDNLSGQ